ncbi:hypothetical protein pb186bvf_011580 [Paramecium bursaria]
MMHYTINLCFFNQQKKAQKMGSCCQIGENNLQIEIKNSYEGFITETSTPNNINVNEIRIQKPFFMCSQKLTFQEQEFSSQKKLNRINNHQGLSPILHSIDNDFESSEGTAKQIIQTISQKIIIGPSQNKISTQSRNNGDKKKKVINMEQLEDIIIINPKNCDNLYLILNKEDKVMKKCNYGCKKKIGQNITNRNNLGVYCMMKYQTELIYYQV